MKLLAVFLLLGFCLGRSINEFSHWSESDFYSNGEAVTSSPLLVNLTLITSAAAKGAVCLDGTVPGYHLDRGFGSGANSWLVNLEGGGWCNNIRTCKFRKTTRHGSSNFMAKQIPFTGIMSNKREENPDFYNWNRVKILYCDGASFSGEGYDKDHDLYFRGQRIWLEAMNQMMLQGMKDADQALLAGCSAGGLASILHCDQFRQLFPANIKVKCFADAGLFLDAIDVAGGRTLRNMFGGVVDLQGVGPNLPKYCTDTLDATSCFFPENLLSRIQTPLFVLNAAYDFWQLQESIAPSAADPHGLWRQCKLNNSNCNADQINFLQGFRSQMINGLHGFSSFTKSGFFINSCFAHCQSERQDTWFGTDSPVIDNKGIAKSVGDWYFDRLKVKAIDCPYPCDKSCHNLVSRQK